jgi:hypothetical protein
LEEKEDSAGRSGGRHRSRFGGGHSSESPFGRVTVTTTTTTNSNIVDKGIVFERVEGLAYFFVYIFF